MWSHCDGADCDGPWHCEWGELCVNAHEYHEYARGRERTCKHLFQRFDIHRPITAGIVNQRIEIIAHHRAVHTTNNCAENRPKSAAKQSENSRKKQSKQWKINRKSHPSWTGQSRLCDTGGLPSALDSTQGQRCELVRIHAVDTDSVVVWHRAENPSLEIQNSSFWIQNASIWNANSYTWRSAELIEFSMDHNRVDLIVMDLLWHNESRSANGKSGHSSIGNWPVNQTVGNSWKINRKSTKMINEKMKNNKWYMKKCEMKNRTCRWS